MKIEMNYKGRRYSSTSSMMRDIERDMVKQAELEMARHARASGLSVRRTSKGIEVSGSESQMSRLSRRIGR